MPKAILLSLLLLSVAAPSPAQRHRDDGEATARSGSSMDSRHLILTAEEGLAEHVRDALQSQGIEVVQPLNAGKYLVRLGRQASPQALQELGRVEELSAEKKLDARLARDVRAGAARARVVFQQDVSFGEGRALLLEAGATLEQPLRTRFETMRSISAMVDVEEARRLAGDERVLYVGSGRRARKISQNSRSATVSNVSVLHAPPYDLTGSGVVLSLFELGAASASHREFGGRLTVHFTGGPAAEQEHATHVAGTMIASGVDAMAKGMAPNATAHEFNANADDFLEEMESLDRLQVVTNNNSWGWIFGWCPPSSCEGDWVWDDGEELLGGYDVFYTAPFDAITRASDVLIVFASGNYGSNPGPTSAPFAHRHVNSRGQTIRDRTFCYSQDGSGNDCPAPCSTGAEHCELVRHPVNSPWSSIGPAGSAKNIIATGAIDLARNIATFSSRGPMRDGRVKPDLVARGVNVFSTTLNGNYESRQGTSMAAPVVTGISALITEQWRRLFGGETPSPAVLKTLMIAGADEVGHPGPDYTFGFGLVNAKAAVDLVRADNGSGSRIKRGALAQSGSLEVPLHVTEPGRLRVVLGWSDPEVVLFPDEGYTDAALVNDLDLKLIDPSGNTILPYVLDRNLPDAPAARGINRVDNTEVVEVAAPAAGTYRAVVTATRISAESPQAFVLVSSSEQGESAVPCSEISEPNNSEATAVMLASGIAERGRTCAAGDADFYRFTVNDAGTISVTVTAVGTPLRATLLRGAVTITTVDVPAGQSRTLTDHYAPGTSPAPPQQYVLRVETAGALGTDTSYSVTATYPFELAPRRRAVRR